MEGIISEISLYIKETLRKKYAAILKDFEDESKHPESNELLSRILALHEEDTVSLSHEHNHELFDIASPARSNVSKKEVQSPAHSSSKTDDGKCTAIIKSGSRKDQPCGLKAVDGTSLCRRHSGVKKVVSSLPVGICETELSSGARKGQACGAKTLPGENVCAKHKAHTCVFKIGNKKCGRPLSPFSPSEKHCRIHIFDEIKPDTSTVIITKNKDGLDYHRYSGLVFEEGKVIGKEAADGALDKTLVDDDFECVFLYKLPLSDPYIPAMIDYVKRRKA